MAALTSINPTYMDLAKLLDPSGKVPMVVELLQETNEVLDDASFVEGNLLDGHQTTVRTGLPTPTWTKIYGFTQPTKSTTAQIIDRTGRMEMYSEIDVRLANLNGNKAAWRLSEERSFVQGLSNELAQTLFYGNEGTEPEAFTGLAPRYNDLAAENADNIINAGGSGADNASIWLVVWGPNTIHGIVPKGSTAGLKMEDLGEETKEDGSNGLMRVLRTHYMWDVGLSLRDWRYVVRIANIDKSLLTNVYTSGAFSSGANLPDLMYQAMRLVPSLGAGRPAFYMGRDTASWVARQRAAMGIVSTKTPNTGTAERGWSEDFDGIPMKRCDALSADEATVS
jgi:hypothetical protein